MTHREEQKRRHDRLLRSRRPLWIATLLAVIIGLSTAPAAALDSREVQAVVTILETLSSETGDTVYFDDEAADEWFDIDDETSQLIPAAGFSRPSWKEAFDRTMTGFIASLPQSELEEKMEEFIDKISEVAEMTPEQKQEATDALRAEMWRFDEIRERGEPYRDVVSPYAERLRSISM